MQNGCVKPLLAYAEDLIGVVAGTSRAADGWELKSTMIPIRR